MYRPSRKAAKSKPQPQSFGKAPALPIGPTIQVAGPVLDAQTALQRAQALANQQRLEEAEALLANFPNHAECLFRRAALLMTLEQPEKAEPLFRKLLAAAPRHFESAMGLAGALVELDRPDEAMPWLDAAVRAQKSVRTLYCRGVALDQAGRTEDAARDLAEARQGIIAPFEAKDFAPQEVLVQISRRCNLRCAMCGHEVWKSNSGFMEPEVFDRVLSECVVNGVKNLRILSGQGEPLLHPNVFEFLEKAVATGMEVSIVTNGTPLTDERCKRLAAIGLSQIQFSFAGWDEASYEATYVGAKFERTLENLKRLGGYIKGSKTNLVVKAVCTGDNWAEVRDKTRAFLESKGVDRIVTVMANNFGGNVVHGTFDERHQVWSLKNLKAQRRMPCRIFLKGVGVFCDGTVTACGCYDSNAELKIGNIMEQSLMEIRQAEPFRRLLESFRCGDVSGVPMCAKCDDTFG